MLKFSGFADLTSCLQMYKPYYIGRLAPKARQLVTSKMFSKLCATEESPCIKRVRGGRAP